jgi:hypothetical protein
MEDFQSELPAAEKKRPTFLLVLCILSWVNGAFSILGEFYAYIAPDTLKAVLKDQIAQNQKAANKSQGFMQEFYLSTVDYLKVQIANFQPFHLSNLVLAIVSVFAVYQMFRYKRSGFFLYTFAQVLMLIIPLIFIVNTATVASAVMLGIFAIAFIIMYAVNLKHME